MSPTGFVVYRSRTRRAAKKQRMGQGVEGLGFEEERRLVLRQMVIDSEPSAVSFHSRA
jgi:hypothetical protein